MSLGSESDIVESLYDAALGRRAWEEVGRGLVSSLDGLTLMLSVHHQRNPAVDVVQTLGMSPQHLRLYGEYYARHDLWALGAVEQRLFGRALSGSQVVEDRVLERSLIYNEFLRPQVNMHYIAGAIVPLDDGHYAVVGVHRPRDAKDYEAGEIRRLDLLLPHLQRALEIRQRVRQAETISQSATAAFDRLSLGVILMGPTGKLLHENAAAEATLRAGDGLVRVPDGIRAVGKNDDKRLQELIVGARRTSGLMTATAVPGGHVRISRLSGRQAYAVMVAPVGPGLAGPGKGTPAVLVFISDPGQQLVSDLAILKELFDFPPSEARLVLALLNGVAPPDFARQAGLSYHTVRTLLARAMDRTDTRSQIELVLLLARSLGGMATKGGMNQSKPNADSR